MLPEGFVEVSKAIASLHWSEECLCDYDCREAWLWTKDSKGVLKPHIPNEYSLDFWVKPEVGTTFYIHSDYLP